jgi:hypothetical protein
MRLSNAEEALLKELRQLPPALLAVVARLVEFLVEMEKQRQERLERESQERLTIQLRTDGPLGQLWDNADDAVYDRL